jgi:sugar phosphate isomerase/epimerase
MLDSIYCREILYPHGKQVINKGTDKIGIFHWYGYIQPFEERIRLIKEADYDYLMLWWEDESYSSNIDRREFVNTIKRYDIKLDNVHLPYDGTALLWGDDKYKRENQVFKIIKWLEECKQCGVETVVMHTEEDDGQDLKYGLGYDSFGKIIKEAENIKVKIAFENTRVFNYTDFILKEFVADHVGFCYDSSHDFIDGQSCGGILEKWKDRLFAVHLSDTDGLKDRHWVPGRGRVAWPKIINTIKQTNCKSFSMETYPYDEEKDLSPFEFLTYARKKLIDKL